MAGHSKKMTVNRNVKEAQFLIRMNDLLLFARTAETGNKYVGYAAEMVLTGIHRRRLS